MTELQPLKAYQYRLNNALFDVQCMKMTILPHANNECPVQLSEFVNIFGGVHQCKPQRRAILSACAIKNLFSFRVTHN